MLRRVIALLLALVLAWSGLSTLEAPAALAQSSTEAWLVSGAPGSTDDGSVEDHHLDDLPVQAQSDPSTDTPGLMGAMAAVACPERVARSHWPALSTVAASPWLAGPLRPPCPPAHAG